MQGNSHFENNLEQTPIHQQDPDVERKIMALKRDLEAVKEESSSIKKAKQASTNSEEIQQNEATLRNLVARRKKLEKSIRELVLTEEQKVKAREAKRRSQQKYRANQGKTIISAKAEIKCLADTVITLKSAAPMEIPGPIDLSNDNMTEPIAESNLVTKRKSRRELSIIETAMDPVKAPTQPIALPCKLDRPFCFKLLLATSSPQNPAQKFNRSQLVAYDEQGNPIQINGRVKLITGHLIRSVGSHVLFMKGVFNQTSGYLDVEATFDNFFRNLAPDLQSIYSVDEFRMTFGGVRFFGSCGNGWLGQRYLMEFSCHVRQLSNAFYTKHPQILRTGTINNDDGSTPSALDRPSKMLFVADDLTYQHWKHYFGCSKFRGCRFL